MKSILNKALLAAGNIYHDFIGAFLRWVSAQLRKTLTTQSSVFGKLLLSSLNPPGRQITCNGLKKTWASSDGWILLKPGWWNPTRSWEQCSQSYGFQILCSWWNTQDYSSFWPQSWTGEEIWGHWEKNEKQPWVTTIRKRRRLCWFAWDHRG